MTSDELLTFGKLLASDIWYSSIDIVIDAVLLERDSFHVLAVIPL